MMLKLSIVLLFATCLMFCGQVVALDSSVSSIIRDHCVHCHGADDETEGDVDLLEFVEADGGVDLELLAAVIRVVDAREMPPEDQSGWDDVSRDALVVDLKKSLSQQLGESAVYRPTSIRRMNRFQYNNSVIDLFDLNCIVFTLPERMMRDHDGYFQPATEKMADTVMVGSRPLGKSQLIEPRLAGVAAFPQDLRAEHGFDNQADHLSLSPLLMESFLRLSQSITHSPDFTPENVGIWESFFTAPKQGNPAEQKETVEPRETVEQKVRERLREFLSRAFRRPVDDKTLDRYSDFAMKKIDSGEDFAEVMKSVASAVISSPRFLYLHERTENPGGDRLIAQPVSDLELASRLSFFLWGSLPDQELRELATRKKLSSPAIVQQQVERMLKDRKLKRFCDTFPSQWLQLDRILSSVPDMQKFPQFYFSKYRNSMHMMLEPLLLFETVLIENRPVHELIDPSFSYRSSLLEKAYGELGNFAKGENVKQGNSVRKLTFNRMPLKDRRTGGVITNAAVMTMTSGPLRTQPITRGAWVASVIFNDPPDPPPADVPALDEKPSAGEEEMTLRERLAKHRERKDCKGCHEQIDPLGFALENFDPIGQWRSEYENARQIDMQGTLLRQYEFNDVVGFKDAILKERHRFARAFAGHLLSFAVARELGAADQLALDQITEAAAQDDYRIKTLLTEVVLSKPFQTKSIRGAANQQLPKNVLGLKQGSDRR